jgi:uncharacterized protein (UPF0303 family)
MTNYEELLERHDYDELLRVLEEEEKTLVFDTFTNEMALQLGLLIINKCKKDSKFVIADITRNGQQLFHYAMTGTCVDYDQWIVKKNNFVYRCGVSSLHCGTLMKRRGTTVEQEYLASSLEYSGNGGAFPIIVKDVGCVGAVTVSGLPHVLDHKLVVDCVREYLGGVKKAEGVVTPTAG